MWQSCCNEHIRVAIALPVLTAATSYLRTPAEPTKVEESGGSGSVPAGTCIVVKLGEVANCRFRR